MRLPALVVTRTLILGLLLGSTAPSLAKPTAGPRAPLPAAATAPVAEVTPPGHDFTPVGHALFAVAACGGGAAPADVPARLMADHCKKVNDTQDEYKGRWVTRGRTFFAEHVPASIPKKVVYPFAGGDLSTALTVYPDADEITTMSLEPAGDPRTLAALIGEVGEVGAGKGKRAAASSTLASALSTIAKELRFLYRVNFSNTMNMIGAMRGGQLPTQLTFGLSALKVHGYEVVALRYFKLGADGQIEYLTDADVAAAPDPRKGRAEARNKVFANAEVRFRKTGGRVQIYRHIQVNLDDTHLGADPRVIKHLDAKGPVAAMTKAASYLLSWDSFSTIRDYLTRNVQWMVSDATGVPTKFGTKAGFTYETYGRFKVPHIGANSAAMKDWARMFAAQPFRKIDFRFGYYDGSPDHTNHLIIMHKP